VCATANLAFGFIERCANNNAAAGKQQVCPSLALPFTLQS
jgi:hypothetical protein